MFRREFFVLSLFIFVKDTVAGNYRIVHGRDLQNFLGTLERYTMTQNDVVFLLDTSGSIGAERFPDMLLFTKLTAQRFSVSAQHSRLSVVTFATDTVTHIDYINDPEDKNMCTLITEIENIGYVGGWRNTDKAMLTAKNILAKSRSNCNRIIIVLLSGESNASHSPVAISENLKNRDVIIFAVGVAGVNVEEISAVATSPHHVYILSDFDYIKSLNKYLVDDARDVSIDLVNDTSQCNAFCTAGVDCCDDHAHCYCGTITGRYTCACIAGYHGNGHRSQCHKCINGTFKVTALNNICTSCPEHSSTLNEGSTSFSDCMCEPGYEWNQNYCTACSKGTYKNEAGNYNCTLCPAHSTNLKEGSTYFNDCLCEYGYERKENICTESTNHEFESNAADSRSSIILSVAAMIVTVGLMMFEC